MLSLENFNKRKFPLRVLATSALALSMVAGVSIAHADDSPLPKLANKKPLRVGFAQTESNNPWRLAETKSFKDIAAKCGWQMVMTDANSSASKQVADIQSMIAQRRFDRVPASAKKSRSRQSCCRQRRRGFR